MRGGDAIHRRQQLAAFHQRHEHHGVRTDVEYHLAAHRQETEDEKPLLIAKQFQKLRGLAGLLRQLSQGSGADVVDLPWRHSSSGCNGWHDSSPGQLVRTK